MNYFRHSINDPNTRQYEEINRLRTESIGDLDLRLDAQIEKYNRLKVQKQLEAKEQIDSMTNRILIDIESKQKQDNYQKLKKKQKKERIEVLKNKREMD